MTPRLKGSHGQNERPLASTKIRRFRVDLKAGRTRSAVRERPLATVRQKSLDIES